MQKGWTIEITLGRRQGDDKRYEHANVDDVNLRKIIKKERCKHKYFFVE